MLVLKRNLLERILIGQDITITVVEIGRRHVKIGIEAPQQVAVFREELLASGPMPERKMPPTQ